MDQEIDKTIVSCGLEIASLKPVMLSDAELQCLYRGAISLVVTSFLEGFCLPAAEAMASGCPVIGINAGALSEIIGGAGMFVSPGFLLDAIRKISDPKTNTLYSKRGIIQSETNIHGCLCPYRLRNEKISHA